MALPNELVSQLVKIVGSRGSDNQDYTVYGTIVDVGDQQYVRLDGSDIDTPFESTVEVTHDDRVMVEVKDHTATVTGNTTNPSIGTKTANGFRSSIEQNANNIKLAVEEIGKTNTTIELLPDQIKSTVKADYIDPINGKVDKFSEFKQTFDTFEFINEDGKVKISSGNLELTGAISFSDLTDSDEVQEQIDDANDTASSAKTTANSANTKATTANNNATAALNTVNGWAHADNGTYINGKMIYSDSIYADKIHLGGCLTVYKTTEGTEIGGYLGYDSGFNSTSGIGVRHSSSTGQVVCTNQAARLSYGGVAQVVTSQDRSVVARGAGVIINAEGGNSELNANGYIMLKALKAITLEVNGTQLLAVVNDGTTKTFRPHADITSNKISTLVLGHSNYYFAALYSDNVYANTCTGTTSDRNQKNSIEDLPEKYLKLFDNLRPVRYKLNSGSSGRYHVGYIAQEVEEAMAKAGIDSSEFGGFVKDKDEDGNEYYMLRYGEFDGIRDAKIKQLETKLDEAYSIIDELKTRLDKLEAKEVG